jgi:hypothetical protein
MQNHFSRVLPSVQNHSDKVPLCYGQALTLSHLSALAKSIQVIKCPPVSFD